MSTKSNQTQPGPGPKVKSNICFKEVHQEKLMRLKIHC